MAQLIIAHFKNEFRLGTSMGEGSIMGWFGGIWRICFQPRGPQMITQLKLCTPSLAQASANFRSGLNVIAQSATKNFGNDVCKCSAIRRAILLENLQKFPVKL